MSRRTLRGTPEMHKRAMSDWQARRDAHAQSARALATNGDCKAALRAIADAAFADGQAAAHRRSLDRTPGTLSIFPSRDAVIKACARARRSR
jgi:hypothetical protein